MPKTAAKKKKTQEVELSWYEGYDLTGGGPPFGHVRVFRVELTIKKKSIVRNEFAGSRLKALIETKGRAIGEPKVLPWNKDYRSGRVQKFKLPSLLTAEQIEKEIPYESVTLLHL